LIPLLLVLAGMTFLDLQQGGVRALIARYNLPLAVFLHVTVALWLARQSPRWAAAGTVALVALGAASCVAYFQSPYIPFRGGDEALYAADVIGAATDPVLVASWPMPPNEMIRTVELASALRQPLEFSLQDPGAPYPPARPGATYFLYFPSGSLERWAQARARTDKPDNGLWVLDSLEPRPDLKQP
jgi:hypothetical protein